MLIDLLISGILAFIMLSVGLALRMEHFWLVFKHPRSLLLGLFLQLICLPLLAFGIAAVSPLPGPLAAGVLLLAACPGGMTSNFISYLLEGNTALSVTLTISNSILAMVTIPFIVNYGLDYFSVGLGQSLGQLPFSPTVGRIFLIVLVPVLVGLVLAKLAPSWAKRAQLSLRWITLALLASLFAIKFLAPAEAGGSGLTLTEVSLILPISLAINVSALTLGWMLSRAAGLPRDNQLTLGVEIGIQNTSLAFLIAGTLLANEDLLKPALVYAMFSFFTAVVYGLLLKPHQFPRLRAQYKEWRE